MTRTEPQIDRSTKQPEFDVQRIRDDFPILSRKLHGGVPLVYLDNAATIQKPAVVVAALTNFYTAHNANVHRGMHTLSMEATEQFEAVRTKAARFINAASADEMIYVRGVTEAINLIARTYGDQNLGPGDEILITAIEHHSNIVPWQMLCERTGATLRVGPINDRGELLFDQWKDLLSEKTKIVSMVHVSNSLGTVNPIKRAVAAAHEVGAIAIIDGAQASAHTRIDVRDIDCDFYAISGHKMCGPTGIGLLYGRAQVLAAMPPFHGGGDMIESVTFEKTTYKNPPGRFEAGTPNISGVIGLGAAIDYLESIGIDAIATYEADLMDYAVGEIEKIEGLRIIGTPAKRAGAISFVLDGIHPHDTATVLDTRGIAIRAGHHCTQPVMQFFGVPATSRASIAFYNTRNEIDALVEGLHHVIKLFT